MIALECFADTTGLRRPSAGWFPPVVQLTDLVLLLLLTVPSACLSFSFGVCTWFDHLQDVSILTGPSPATIDLLIPPSG